MRTEPYRLRISWLARAETIETAIWSKKEAQDEYSWIIGQFDGREERKPDEAALVALVAPDGSLLETCVA
jgi:hypothetical protein